MLNRTNQRIPYCHYLKRQVFQSKTAPYYFAYGRTALKLGLMHLKLQNSTILVPEYICETVTEVFKTLNISIVYYPVNDNLSPKWTVVENLYTSDIKSILMVHYFGIPQSITDFTQFAMQKNILLIEDNSHGSYGMIDNQVLGTYGDIGIASPRKSFPILNGGMLYSKTNIEINTFPLEPQNIPKAIAKNIIGILLDIVPRFKYLFLKNEYKALYSKIPNYSFDVASHHIIENANKQISNRVSIYKRWFNWSQINDLKPLFQNIPETIAPMCFPLLFDSTEQKERFSHFCKIENIAAFSWPDLPVELKTTNNSGNDLYNRILCLPIHNNMNPKKLENRLEKLTFYNKA
jgi:perosamine synthetase